jgi:hypothetical protein
MRCPKCSRYIKDGSESHGKCGWEVAGDQRQADDIECAQCQARDNVPLGFRISSIDMTRFEMLELTDRRLLCEPCTFKFSQEDSRLYALIKLGLKDLGERIRYCHDQGYRAQVDERNRAGADEDRIERAALRDGL